LGRSRTYWWVGFAHQEWVAYSALSVFDFQTMYVGPTFVKPEARGRGLQRVILSLKEEFARSLGVKRLVGVVDEPNPASVKNLEALGFRKVAPWVGAFGTCLEKIL
jgi:L-amino acid N-acyltransferase YncA